MEELEYQFAFSGSTTANFGVRSTYDTYIDQLATKLLSKNIFEHFLKKKYKWILNVLEVRSTDRARVKNGVIFEWLSENEYPITIDVEVSAIHYSELANKELKKQVIEKISLELHYILLSIYGNNHNPHINFYPPKSETIIKELD